MSDSMRLVREGRRLFFKNRSMGAIAQYLTIFRLLAMTANAQTNYATDWWKIAGGEGVSTGGIYSVTGTIGQPDTGYASGGNFRTDSGYWGILSVIQTGGAPLLSIARTATNTIVVSWPSTSTAWVLQQNSNPLTSNWGIPPETVNDNGTNKFIIISPPSGSRFFRLTGSH